MKNILITLLASMAISSTVNSESVWLVVNMGFWYQTGAATAFEKIEMKDMEQCEEQVAKYMGADTLSGTKRWKGYACLKGR